MIPLLNQQGTNLDNQVYRPHIDYSRRCLSSNSFSLFQEPTHELQSSWQDLVQVLEPVSRASTASSRPSGSSVAWQSSPKRIIVYII